MTDAQLSALVSEYSATDVVEFINKYVHTIYFDPSSKVDISCDFDYKKKEPVNQVFYCTNYSDGVITLVPAEDTFMSRMYYNRHMIVDAIRVIECYATEQNEYMKAAIKKAKDLKLANKRYYETKPVNYQKLSDEKNYPPASEG